MISRMKAILAIIVAALILGWPLTHMVLAKSYGLNSWKGSGWGMYASIHPDDTFINLYFVETDSEPLAGLDVGAVIEWTYPVLFKDGESHILGEDAWNEEIFALDGVSTRQKIVVFRDEDAIQAYTEPFIKFMLDPVDIGYTLVFVSQPRLNLWKQIAYTDTEVYMVVDQCVQNLGRYQSDKVNSQEILSQIESQAVPISNAWLAHGCQA